MGMSNVKTQASCHVNMISKARWILTKGTWLGQILFQLLWNESLFFCLSTENIAKKQKKSTYRFVEESLWVFSSGYLQSHTRFGTFTLWSKIRIANLQGKNTFQVLQNEHQRCLSRELLRKDGKGKVHSPFCRGVFEGLFFVTVFTLRLGLGTFNRVLRPKPSPSSNWMRKTSSSMQIKSLGDGHVKC